jgi:hypothetical protein
LLGFESAAKSSRVWESLVRSADSSLDLAEHALGASASCRRLLRTRRSANVKSGSMEAKELVLDEKVGGITAVESYELKGTFDVGEDMPDDVCEDFRDRLWPAIGEHLFEAGTTIAIANSTSTFNSGKDVRETCPEIWAECCPTSRSGPDQTRGAGIVCAGVSVLFCRRMSPHIPCPKTST